MERSSFFNAVLDQNGVPDRSYLAEDFARYFATFIGNGVFPNPSSQLQLVAVDNNMQVRIKQGKAWINGYFYENTDTYIFKLDPADGVLNRIDRIVLRLDFLERKIKAVVKKGDYSSSAIAKNLQRDADAYEIVLADIRINKGVIKITQADITDLRLNKDLCGIVHGAVDQVDTTAIFNQFQSWYSQTKDFYNKDVATWTNEKKQAFDKWYSTNTQAFMERFNTWYNSNTTKWSNDFNEWFATIKGALDGDIGAKLTAKTIELEEKIDKDKKDLSDFKDTVESQMSETTKEIDNLKSSVGSGKDSLYSAIIGKKVTPRSKDFDDLTNAINNIKLGQGNAQPSDVLQGRTFTNDSGIVQNGAITNYGSKIITPTNYTQSFGSGFYESVKVVGDSNLKPENITKGISIFGIIGTANKYACGTETHGNFTLPIDFDYKILILYIHFKDKYYAYVNSPFFSVDNNKLMECFNSKIIREPVEYNFTVSGKNIYFASDSQCDTAWIAVG
ncbi:hypothetical protein RBU49_06945 [Clostridium sp. MB40-C1]|uniref:hypothetical protein n=1 Tax=Clostridium sp. MB40-C1 TaxID=3070996 RepID=UPI0027DF5E6B|nr:hypothetical protein [Clostridium sp. MB40-C1]WMJ81979.1 hypothetical protein RBU49_06945 [Clostridium sp. MB40-C1]